MEDTPTPGREALDRAIKAVETQAALARRVEELTGKPVRTGHIYYWLSKGSVPPEYCAAIETATGVSRQDLRPDDWQAIWPELAEA